MSDSVTLAVRLEAEVLAELVKLARETGLSVNQYARMILSTHAMKGAAR